MTENIQLSEKDKYEILKTVNEDVIVKKQIFQTIDPNGYSEVEIDGCKVNLINFLQLDVYLDSVCNSNCPFCINKAKNAKISDALHKNKLSLEDFIKRFDDVYHQINSQQELKSFIMLTGGEPTISPRFIPFIQHLLKKKIRYDLLTNGSNLHTLINGRMLIEIMAPNCGGMQISRAHYDDNKNQQLMNLSKKVENKNLYKVGKYIENNFDKPYHLGFSCMLMKNGIHTVEDIKKYIETYKDLNLSVIVFREMENVSEYANNIDEINNIIIKYEDLKNIINNDNDFKQTNILEQDGYFNYYYQYKDISTPICFSVPCSMKERYKPSDHINGLTFNPDGKLYYNYFYNLHIK